MKHRPKYHPVERGREQKDEREGGTTAHANVE